MPRKKKQPEWHDSYDLDDVFKSEGSVDVTVEFVADDPGHALACCAYTGGVANTILKRIVFWSHFAADELGWDEDGRRRKVEAGARRAHELFERQLPRKLEEALWELVVEVMFQALQDQGLSEMEGGARLKNVLRIAEEWKKERFNTRGRGRAPAWSLEDRAAFLARYEEALAAVKDARKIFRASRRGVDWRAAVRAAYPEIPDEVLEEIQHLEIKKSEVARKWAAVSAGFPDSEYLRRILTAARREPAADKD